jgi:hypothetical protein
MNSKFDKLTKKVGQSVTERGARGPFGMALVCLGLVNTADAQTIVVCDPTGDAIYSNGKGGPKVPRWLDLVEDNAPSQTSGLILATWSYSSNTAYGCQ